LQGEIVAFYLERAEQALQEEAFDLAIENYRNILKVSPDNTEVLDQIDVTLKKKNVHAMLNDLDQLAEAKAEVQAEIKELRKEKYKTRAQNQTSRRRRSDAVPDPVADASSSDGISDLGIDLLSKALGGQEEGEAQPNPSPAASSQTSVSKAPKLVEESQIDGGKKAYLHIAVPEVPQSLRSEDLVMVLAECVVGTDGEVESVKLVSPAENDAYNKLAKDALQQYRYKPATFSGMPVRFKAVEVLSF
ncbi:MAG TPA: energy transducer TonB, partial [Calditrichia bacterium]|nr:energy transducer TonB [Calditrichia bacterium]